MTWLNDQFMQAGGADLTDDPGAEADLREKAEMAKRSLTTVAKTNVVLSHDGTSKVILLTRDQFNDLTAHLLSRSRDLTESVLEEAGVPWSRIDRVLLVGGSTRMPMVREMVEGLAGKPAERTINPDEVVALGAAVQAYLSDVENGSTETLPELFQGAVPKVLDVTSQGLGTLAQKDDGSGAMENVIIIPRNTKIPSQLSNVFSTVVDQQQEVLVQVTQGDDVDPDYVGHIGQSTLKIPPYPRGAPIEVIFSYDIDQTIHIEVVDLTAGASLGMFEVDAPANMTPDEVASASDKIQNTDVG
jgi:molecular chaperone DnaK